MRWGTVSSGLFGRNSYGVCPGQQRDYARFVNRRRRQCFVDLFKQKRRQRECFVRMTRCKGVEAVVTGPRVCCDVGMKRLARVVRCVAFGCLSRITQ